MILEANCKINLGLDVLRRRPDGYHDVETVMYPVRGLFDRVEIYYEDEGETETIRLMTTLRQDARNGIISKESPLGKAILGRKVGDRAEVRVSDDVRYFVVIRSIEKGTDDDSLPIAKY